MPEVTLIPHSRPEIEEQSINAVINALRHGHLSDGHEVMALEKALSEMFDDAHVVAVSSGTAALYLSLAALGIQSGDKVIIPSYTCNSLFSAVSFAGAQAVCADTREGYVNISKETIEHVIDSSVKSIIVPHTCGYMANIPEISTLGIPIIEDCAQAVGGYYPDGSLLGTKGKIATFSFFATKLLPAGEGGACITKDPDIANTIRELGNCDKRRPNPRSFNFKMSDTNAALALTQLKNLRGMITKRNEIADAYDETFGNQALRTVSTESQPVCFRYLLKINTSSQSTNKNDIDSFIQKAEAVGIECKRPIWRPIHYATGAKCPHTEMMDKTLVSVPIYPGLKKDEITRIRRETGNLLEQLQ